MSERFGIADHDAQIPDHALQNPTPSDPVGGMGGFQVPAYSPPIYAGGMAGTYGTYIPRKMLKRSMTLAVVLATVLGPLGLFYVNILNGIAALVIVPTVIRHLAVIIGLRPGGDVSTLAILLIMWCITVPWSIVGVKIHNGRIQSA